MTLNLISTVALKAKSEGKSVRVKSRADFPLLILLLYLAAFSNQGLHYILDALKKPITPLKGFATLFMKLDIMINKWNYRQDYALQIASNMSDNRSLSQFLLRLSQAINVGTSFKDFMKIEYTKFIIISQKEHQILIDKLRWLSEAYSAMITAGTVLSVSMIAVSTLLGTASANQSLQLTLVGVPTAASALVVLIARAGLKYETITDLDAKPYKLTLLSRSGKILFFILVFLTPIIFYVSHLFGSSFWGWLGMAISGLALLLFGKIALREIKRIKGLENQFMLFIKVLGEAASATGTLNQGLILVSHSEFGKLSNHIKKLVSKLTIGFDNEVSWLNFAAETGSKLISDFTQILLFSVKIGGKIIETCQTISDWMNEELSRRSRREQASNYLKGLVFPIQGTLIAILTMTSVLIEIFNRFAAFSTNIQVRFVNPIDLQLLLFFNFILLFALAIISASAIYFTEGGSLFNLYYNLGLLLLISGLGVILVQAFTFNILGLFSELGSNLGTVIP
ncbi:MAG: type II secretion system F family protein [Nitrososphaerales archaeon]